MNIERYENLLPEDLEVKEKTQEELDMIDDYFFMGVWEDEYE
jgi:hypothetical protein